MEVQMLAIILGAIGVFIFRKEFRALVKSFDTTEYMSFRRYYRIAKLRS